MLNRHRYHRSAPVPSSSIRANADAKRTCFLQFHTRANGHGFGLPATQEPVPRSFVRAGLRKGARLLSGDLTRSLHCRVALEIDPIGLVRNRRGPSGEGHALEEYVNDRPYAASSFLSVAIARTFGTAITGKSKERQELADRPLPLETRITVLPCRGGESLLRRLFEPLGYEVTAVRHPLDEKFPSGERVRTFRSDSRPQFD